MKTERKILLAFLLNLSFSVFEFVGGLYTGSIAILSDAVHDLGDAAGIGLSFLLERKSRRPPDELFTYGYARYSVLGSLITTLILIFGSAAVMVNAIRRFFSPTPIHYDGMILFAVVGVCVNLIAALFTRDGDSLNQKAVNLHMLEDVLGWAVVLVGAVVMRFTDLTFIDPLLSLCVAGFILFHARGNLREVSDLFLMRTPKNTDVAEIQKHLCAIDGVLDVHHIHLWSMDGLHHYASMHIVTNSDPHTLKAAIRAELREHSIAHTVLELESEGESCEERICCMVADHAPSHHHHHHHHHH